MDIMFINLIVFCIGLIFLVSGFWVISGILKLKNEDLIINLFLAILAILFFGAFAIIFIELIF